jgi:hypothetical protein
VALDPLADPTDLPSAWQESPDAERALLVASAAIRDAAGAPISRTTATVTIPAPTSGRVLALPGPVTAVTAVSIDGTEVTDYENLGDGLWRSCGWAHEPVPVSVTGTFGLTEVPADIVDLTCQLAVAWLQHNDAGGGSTAGLTSAAIDDARETYSDESAGQISPTYIPEATRNWLARRFGGGAVVVETL